MDRRFVVARMETLAPKSAACAEVHEIHRNREIQSFKIVPEGVELTKGPTRSIIKCGDESAKIVVLLLARISRGHQPKVSRVGCLFSVSNGGSGGGGGSSGCSNSGSSIGGGGSGSDGRGGDRAQGRTGADLRSISTNHAGEGHGHVRDGGRAHDEVQVEIWENERYYMLGFGWSTTLLPTDRSAYLYKRMWKHDGWNKLKHVPVKHGWEWKDSWVPVNPPVYTFSVSIS
jgi:hypothetical protein